MKNPKTRRLVAIMFTDIVGYTALMQQNEEAAAAVRVKHRQAFQQQHQVYSGEILQYFGDGTLSIFQSGVEAVECAIAIQKALNKGKGVPLRIGLHIGDIVFDGTEIYGDSVNLASRIENMGTSGAVLLSGKLNDELKNHPQISTRSLGFFELKNINRPIELFAVTNPGVNVPDPSDLKKAPIKPNKSIAVLPFVNISSSKENEYFSDGMTEEIINALSKIKSLRVTSRTSSFFFKNKRIPIRQIGRELNVSAILEGSIRLSGNKMRLTAQLIDVADDFHFWSETFDRSIDDIFAVQDEISLLIADKLREHIGHFDIADQLVDTPSISVDVYQRYLKSRYHLLKMSKPEIEKGIEISESIISEQPDFPLAYLGVHLGYTLLGTIGLMPAGEAFIKGKAYLDKAIELDENLPECQLHLSYICLLQDWDLKSTYEHLKKAYEIRPTVEYYQSMASTLVAEGRFTAAENYTETALQLDPFSHINYHLKGFILYVQEKYEPAIECFEKSINLKPDARVSILYKGQALLLAGRAEEGLAFFQNLPKSLSGDLMKPGGTTLTYAASGDLEKARAGIVQLESALQTDMMERALNLLILCQAILNNKDDVYRLIELGIQYHLPMFVYLNVEPILKPFQPDQRFRQLMQQILGQTSPFNVPKRKYKKALFTKAQLKQYCQQLERLMVNEKPYLEPGLSLRNLAKMMDLPPNHLSQLLNEGFNKNFAEFVNHYRLKAFKAKASDPARQHLTILALAYDSGFNSKTVFNTFFKKMTGQTPSAYWKEIIDK